jgi:hypothetical protein
MENDTISDRIETFLATWDRSQWMIDHGEWSEEGEHIAEGLLDPDAVSDDAVKVDSGTSWNGWDCREGYSAHRHGNDLYLNWWRTPYRHTNRHHRDLWVLVESDFFAEEES